MSNVQAGNPSRALRIALILAGCYAIGLAVLISINKFFTIDEFQYAHAAWLVSQGAVPYRDFFDHHFPFIYQLLSALFLILGNEPQQILTLRLAMLPILGLIALAAYRINLRAGRHAGGFAILMLFLCWPFMIRATEIRPDPLALAFFLCALCTLYEQGLSTKARGFVAGLLLTAAVWSSQKLFIYGLGFVAFFLRDLVLLVGKREESRYGLGSPIAFAAGSLAGLIPIAIYLFATGSAADFFHWTILWPYEHEKGFEGFSWLVHFKPFAASYGWTLPLVLLGIVSTCTNWWRTRKASSPDIQLLLALPLTFLAYAIQKAPYAYSLLPFLGIVAILAGRGVSTLIEWAYRAPQIRPHWRRSMGATIGILVIFLLLWSSRELMIFFGSTNANQLITLRELGTMTDATDAVYDNSGTSVTRPHSHFYYFTSAQIRSKQASLLSREIPAAIRQSESTVFVNDIRTRDLPGPLQQFLLDHYVRVFEDIWIWGKEFRGDTAQSLPAERIERFEVIKAGDYYVHPQEILRQGTLRIDGHEILGPIFRVAKGDHEVSFRGPPHSFFILWRPRNEKLYPPLPIRRSRLSGM